MAKAKKKIRVKAKAKSKPTTIPAKILAHLAKHPSKSFTSDQLAVATKHDQHSVSSAACRLFAAKKVGKIGENKVGQPAKWQHKAASARKSR